MSTRNMRRLAAGIVACTLAFATAPVLAQDVSTTRSAATAGAIVHTEDVDLFYRIYDAAGGHPTAEQLQHHYPAKASDRLQVISSDRNGTAPRTSDNKANK